jgi:hypothetical protein
MRLRNAIGGTALAAVLSITMAAAFAEDASIREPTRNNNKGLRARWSLAMHQFAVWKVSNRVNRIAVPM